MVKLDIFCILKSYLKANDMSSYHHPFPTVKHMTADCFNIPVLTGRTLEKLKNFFFDFRRWGRGFAKVMGNEQITGATFQEFFEIWKNTSL